jgi:hypothetical protein
MAIHTATGFVALGVVLLALVKDEAPPGNGDPRVDAETPDHPFLGHCCESRPDGDETGLTV